MRRRRSAVTPRCRSPRGKPTTSPRRQPTRTAMHLTFSISNRPAWAAFNSSTGRLSGTPEIQTPASTPISSSQSATAPRPRRYPYSRSRSPAPHRGAEAHRPEPPPAVDPSAAESAAHDRSAAPTNPPPATNSPPQISGTPPTTAPARSAVLVFTVGERSRRRRTHVLDCEPA